MKLAKAVGDGGGGGGVGGDAEGVAAAGPSANAALTKITCGRAM